MRGKGYVRGTNTWVCAALVGLIVCTACGDPDAPVPVPVPVPEPENGPWLHEPAGFTPTLNVPWSDILSLTAEFPGNHALVANQGDAPVSPPSAVDFWYPAGLQAGYSEFGKLWFSIPPASVKKEIVIGLRVVTQFVGIEATRFDPNKTNWESTPVAGETDVPISRGVWHKYEVYLNLPEVSGGAGTCKIWVDGILALNRDPTLPADRTMLMSFAGQGWETLYLDPIWGGGESIKIQRDDIWFDHLYVSMR